MTVIADITHYPIKALSAQHLAHTDLTPGRGIAGDRRFALTYGSAGRNLDVGATGAIGWCPPNHFLTLKRHARLAALQTHYTAENGVLRIARRGRTVAEANILTATGRDVIDQFFAALFQDSMSERPRLVDAADGHLSDRQQPFISIINKASVDDIHRLLASDGRAHPIDPLRFRGNILVEGWAPWAEMEFIGREFTVGSARVRIAEHIGRCAATNVNPDNAERDLNILKGLHSGLGHTVCGVYAVVETGGRIAVGDAISSD